MGRLDEPIPITAAIETVVLSWSSFYIRLDLYAPLDNKPRPHNTELLAIIVGQMGGATGFVHSNPVGLLLELQLSRLSNTATLSDRWPWGGPLRTNRPPGHL